MSQISAADFMNASPPDTEARGGRHNTLLLYRAKPHPSMGALHTHTTASEGVAAHDSAWLGACFAGKTLRCSVPVTVKAVARVAPEQTVAVGRLAIVGGAWLALCLCGVVGFRWLKGRLERKPPVLQNCIPGGIDPITYQCLECTHNCPIPPSGGHRLYCRKGQNSYKGAAVTLAPAEQAHQ